MYVEPVERGVPDPAEFENHSTTQPVGAVAVKVVDDALLHAVTFPPEFGEAGSALTVMEIGAVAGHCVWVLVADTV